jgi:hypothetical protein
MCPIRPRRTSFTAQRFFRRRCKPIELLTQMLPDCREQT